MVCRLDDAKSFIREHPKLAAVFTYRHGLIRFSAGSAKGVILPLFSGSFLLQDN